MSESARHAPGIVISGYYGFANAGDEAILTATVQGLRRWRPNVSITVLAGARTAVAPPGVDLVPRYSLRAILRVFQPGSLLLSGGGGLFQDTTSRRSLLYYLGIVQLARLRGMKTMVYAQGLGPLRRRSSRWLVRWALGGVDAISFRDEASRRLLDSLGLAGRAAVTADPVFCLEPASPDRANIILEAEGLSDCPGWIAVSLRDWPGWSEGSRSAVAAAIKDAAVKHHLRVVITPMQPASDGPFSRSLLPEAAALQGDYSAEDLAALLGHARLVVGMRLHSLIFAAIAGTPGIAISYDPKVDAIAAQLEAPSFSLAALSAGELHQAIDSAIDAGVADRRRVLRAAEALRERAEQNFRIIADLI